MSPISMGFRFREMRWRCNVALPADAPVSGVGPIPKSSSLLVQEGDTLGWVSSLARGIPSAFNRSSGITVASFVISGHGCDCPWCLSPGVTALNFWETQNWKADEARDRMSQPHRIQVMMGP
jgi:hypothetical protein